MSLNFRFRNVLVIHVNFAISTETNVFLVKNDHTGHNKFVIIYL